MTDLQAFVLTTALLFFVGLGALGIAFLRTALVIWKTPEWELRKEARKQHKKQALVDALNARRKSGEKP